MNTTQLEIEFRKLISGGNRATIELSEHFLVADNPLVAFLDNLSEPLACEIAHHLRSARGRVIMLQNAITSCWNKPQKIPQYTHLLHKAYHYKAFMRELVARWG
jgi:hypothetical protein